MSNIVMPPASVGHTPLMHNATSVRVAMRTFEFCDVEPVKNQVFEPVVVYKKKHIDKKPVVSKHSPVARRKEPK
jgi:hypothetical protein